LYAGRFHLHDRRSGGAQFLLLGGGLRYVIDGGKLACGEARGRLRGPHGDAANRCGHKYISDSERGIERATKSGADYGCDIARRINGTGGLSGACAVSNHHDSSAVEIGRTTPIDRKLNAL
jgi:hypothetical protein